MDFRSNAVGNQLPSRRRIGLLRQPASLIISKPEALYFGRSEGGRIAEAGLATVKGNSMLVSDILKSKGHKVQSVKSIATLGELAVSLKAARVGVMIVSDDGKALDGIISERDIVGAMAEHGSGVETLRVGDVSTKAVLTCGLDSTVGEVARLMTTKRIRHVPVVDGDRIVGIVSIGDVLKHRLDEMQLEANVLRDVAIAVR